MEKDNKSLTAPKTPTRKNNRKSLVVDNDVFGQTQTSVEPLAIKEMILECTRGKSYLEQLCYRHVPNFNNKGRKCSKTNYTSMNRDPFVRQMYRLFEPVFNNSRKGDFDLLKHYIRWLDATEHTAIDGDFFHPKLVDGYMAHWGEKVTKGAKKASWAKAKNMLSFLLKAQGRYTEAANLPVIIGARKDTKSHEGIEVTEEFRPLIKHYLKAFSVFSQHVHDGTKPEIHPLWDEALFNQQAKLQSCSKQVLGSRRATFKKAVTTGKNSWLNHFSRLAAMLTFCFTGQNTSPILNLRHKDVKFCSKMDGKVYFDMQKDRANYLDFDTSMGFKPHVQKYFERWMVISCKLQEQSGTDWLFPWHSKNGDVVSFIEIRRSPQIDINKLTSYLGLAHVTPSSLRQTKIDTLMKVTQDIWLVSMSSNNHVNALKASYASGQPQDHRRNLIASNVALFDIARGDKSIDESVNAAKYQFCDVLSDYDYRRLRECTDNEVMTPIGSRCNDFTKGAAKIIKNNLEKSGMQISGDEVCTDFLSCFTCPEHRLIAGIEDIWLMLSFNDTLQEMKEYPAINSLPTPKFQLLCNTIKAVLQRYSEVSPDNYQAASKKHKEAPHSLYSDAYSLNDLLEVF
ncbi:hypothetical protein RGL59_004714 [Vibrio parahaemolyticus]|uniref:hypothetical protein n=1 Tax=Vibrio harveyi group TaxID=717610 RepID=UPI0006ACF16E|nr:hypothetical protein [Vibrio parahaemolyticus]EIJ2378982.1 hypothetical protein [Vibrio alginolyticus]EGQ9862995.1 hypothetical protein [Vibrio parahaemolyticus]EGR2252619.1 hypothetical protein [Vibrio parahaemolyticus]EJG1623715.1 hypothetical protein [Vibrio parahaemolyticus]EJG1689485.1 hypothetical protein [Vibrio parahaemolyticus]